MLVKNTSFTVNVKLTLNLGNPHGKKVWCNSPKEELVRQAMTIMVVYEITLCQILF